MYANNHHNDGHIAVYIPAEPGAQATLIQSAPRTYFRPPYVGVKGWVAIELDQISDEDLAVHLQEAHRLIAPVRPHKPNEINNSRLRFVTPTSRAGPRPASSGPPASLPYQLGVPS